MKETERGNLGSLYLLNTVTEDESLDVRKPSRSLNDVTQLLGLWNDRNRVKTVVFVDFTDSDVTDMGGQRTHPDFSIGVKTYLES